MTFTSLTEYSFLPKRDQYSRYASRGIITKKKNTHTHTHTPVTKFMTQTGDISRFHRHLKVTVTKVKIATESHIIIMALNLKTYVTYTNS